MATTGFPLLRTHRREALPDKALFKATLLFFHLSLIAIQSSLQCLEFPSLSHHFNRGVYVHTVHAIVSAGFSC